LGKTDVYAMFRAKHDILYAIHDEWIDELLAAGRATMRPGARRCGPTAPSATRSGSASTTSSP
jgi:hypothetical protein